MQGYGNRMGLGMQSHGYTQGQGPPIGSLPPSGSYAYPPRPPLGQTAPGAGPPGPAGPGDKLTTLFVGSISAGVSNELLTSLFATCGVVKNLTRQKAANGKLQGFGFLEYQEPDAVARALKLLQGKVIPAQEPDQPNKPLVVRADDKVKAHLQIYEASRIRTDQDDEADKAAEAAIALIITQSSKSAVESGLNTADSAQAAVPQHLRDLTEADLPENQRGLVISEIALFRERATARTAAHRGPGDTLVPSAPSRSAGVGGFTGAGGMATVPSGPKTKERVWGKRNDSTKPPESPRSGSFGNGPQGYQGAPDFVKRESAGGEPVEEKDDEQIERERVGERKRNEDESFRDRERRWENRERVRIGNIERTIAKSRMTAASRDKEASIMRESLRVWDDDESDELFYTDRSRWRSQRAKFLKEERSADERHRIREERQAEELRKESEAFLAQQMEEMQGIAEEQRKAGKLLLSHENGAPVKLSIGGAGASAATTTTTAADGTSTTAPSAATATKAKVPARPAFTFGNEDEDEEASQKKKTTLVKIDFGGIDADSKKERLDKIRASIKGDKESLFKHKIRWDGINDSLIDGKLQKLVRTLMINYLGELDDDDMVFFVLEHLKDHKHPSKIVEGLEPVLLEEADEFAISLWRQLVFESVAYGEGFETDNMMVD